MTGDGRLTFGIGLSHRVVIEDMLGLDFARPVRHLREYLTVLTGLLGGEAVDCRGSEYRVAAQLRVAGVTTPPVLVAALGRQMLDLTGRLADGTITWLGGPKYLAEVAVPAITRAAAAAGRTAPRVVAGFPIAVTDRVDDARAAANRQFAFYNRLPSYRAVLDLEGSPDIAGACLIGDEPAIRAALRHLADSGVTDFAAAPFPVPSDPDAVARTHALLRHLTGRQR